MSATIFSGIINGDGRFHKRMLSRNSRREWQCSTGCGRRGTNAAARGTRRFRARRVRDQYCPGGGDRRARDLPDALGEETRRVGVNPPGGM
jgi:hypothetical protein